MRIVVQNYVQKHTHICNVCISNTLYYTYIQCMHNLLMREFSSEDDQIVVLEKYIRLSGMLKETLICF